LIATIINFCTNDIRFLARAIEEAKSFSSTIIIPICDHFFDGKPENRPLLEQIYATWPECEFIEFAWDVKELYTPFLEPLQEEERICLWHSTARYIACHFLKKEIEYLLFLDVDEIPEGKRFAEWLSQGEYRMYDALWFWSYRYRFSASERLLEEQYAPLLVRRTALEPSLVLNTKERFGILETIVGTHWLKGKEDRPFFHHYSWVRSKEECLQKVRTWGKRTQENWEEKLEEAWNKGDFLEDVAFEKVDPYFDPLTVVIPKGALVAKKHSNVRLVNATMMFQRSVDELLI
jgi:hypothetical protein